MQLSSKGSEGSYGLADLGKFFNDGRIQVPQIELLEELLVESLPFVIPLLSTRIRSKGNLLLNYFYPHLFLLFSFLLLCWVWE